MRIMIGVLALALAPITARAADPVTPPVPDAALLARMCSPGGAMQFTFGQTGVPGSSRIESDLGQGYGLPDDFAPFSGAQPRATQWSGQFMEMTYKVRMPKEAAESYAPRLAEALAAAGWTSADMEDGQQPLYLVGYGGGHTFARPVGEGASTSRVLAHVDYGLGELTLTCGRDDLLKIHAREAFGDLPPGTPRPVPPEIPLPPVTLAADCKDPAKLAAMTASLADHSSDSYIGLMIARTSWRDRLTQWMTWKLESSGKVSKDRMFKLILNSVGSASPGGNPLATLELLPDLFAMAERMGKAEEAHDQTGVRVGIVDFHAFIAKADAITLNQTKALHSALRAEAARLGVSLD